MLFEHDYNIAEAIEIELAQQLAVVTYGEPKMFAATYRAMRRRVYVNTKPIIPII
jgi:hypothetical protein